MKQFAFFLFFTLLNLSSAKAFDGGIQTQSYCSAENTCAYLQFPVNPNTRDESSFTLYLLPHSTNAVIENRQIKLWRDMGHGRGHGSAPVLIRDSAEETFRYDVSNAWFVMAGVWNVIVTFKENGIDQKIVIPVPVND